MPHPPSSSNGGVTNRASLVPSPSHGESSQPPLRSRRRYNKKNIGEKEKFDKRDQYGWTPLHYVAYHYNSMETLLECDISATYIGDNRKMMPFHIAISRGYIPDEIISRCPDCYEFVDERGWNDVDGNTPLHFLVTFRPDLLWRIRDMDEDIKLDLDLVNNQNMSVHEVIMKSGSSQLEESVGPYRYGVVSVNKKRPEVNVELKKEMEKAKESHLIVAALIATVTFTGAFTLPGGVIQDGDKEGTAILRGTSSSETSAFLMLYGAGSTMMVMGAMVIAFVTSTYAVYDEELEAELLKI
ncbi:hypothetical protein EZV62_007232 [Acer yangbiense]|uniref:PGG domain-containing protein n=1 Tax=Acer yangbiense TaxID=1000413 RepID=A0A5C7I9V3_9ROSI|nr:hypothetical protein EZV62_007232 [Acer yangbiense]